MKKSHQLIPKLVFSFVFLFIWGLCAQCPQLCETCSGTVCSACFQDFHAGSEIVSAANLNCPCPQGYFLNTASGLCNFCPSRCTSCSSPTTCLVCLDGYQLNSTSGECEKKEGRERNIEISLELSSTGGSDA